MSAHNGKDCLVEFSIQPETAAVPTVWTTLGMMRTKSMSGTWDTADSTADSTPDSSKTAIATRKSCSFSGDGVSHEEAIHGQRALKNQFYNPGAATQNQPKAWIKLSYPTGETFTGPFLMTSWKDDAPTDDVCTWSLEATGNGNVVYDDGVV